MSDDMKPEIGDTVEFAATGKYGTYEDNARGEIVAVYANGKIRVRHPSGVYYLFPGDFIILARAA